MNRTSARTPRAILTRRSALERVRKSFGAAVAGGVLQVALALTACGPSSPATTPTNNPPPCAALKLDVAQCAATYQAALSTCTAVSKTRAESEACEDRVRAEYGRPPRSGKVDTPASDAAAFDGSPSDAESTDAYAPEVKTIAEHALEVIADADKALEAAAAADAADGGAK